MPSIQSKMIGGLFKLIGVKRMLDKQGADLKVLEHFVTVLLNNSRQ